MNKNECSMKKTFQSVKILSAKISPLQLHLFIIESFMNEKHQSRIEDNRSSDHSVDVFFFSFSNLNCNSIVGLTFYLMLSTSDQM